MATKPTFEQAKLHLEVYDMRREPRLRQARDWFFSKYFANTFDEAMRIASSFPWARTGRIEVRPVRDMDAVRQRVGA